MEDLLVVGQIINTHGLRGEMKVMPLTEDMRRFDYLEYVILKGQKIKVEGVKYFKDKVILKLEGINSIEEAEKLKRIYLEIEREDAIELEEDEYFIVDLVGCTVVDTEGFEYGKIKDVIQTPSNDVYWVQGKKEVLVPVLKDIVLDINMDEKLITIRPSGGWQYED
ncbi:16S rRNA processing protein RimM [Clostridium perfringens]|uniref:ribosome maturation factor RimM n=1 Tax=Clostridium perfringens TaxID=1502 RepID=UPI000E1743E8|nr:ribosome maturation factor RimM [Clostridium perfringens]EJT5916163.1 16S rRNA processing protein RimM [Clostridium perfringens]EJT6134989.1 16S rRNA processing protein RimM [Clostridium perfringens]EJT6149903.1 16S rRNA processing protein RimM [Clostridium perfringens]EJT6155308.1 16S rRNA processing protein RimM [Clostridium perfringens]UBK57387.1 16S rRNA processing protein RimM [Clostridium perfringens]